MAPRAALERLKARPAKADWDPDELVTLAEASALMFPRGPLTRSALRIAHRRGELAAIEVNGRLLTTLRHVSAMVTPSLRQIVVDDAEVLLKQAHAIEPATKMPVELRRRIAAARSRRSLPPIAPLMTGR